MAMLKNLQQNILAVFTAMLIALLFNAAAVSAQNPDTGRTLDFLFQQLKNAKKPSEAKRAEDEIWKIWMMAPDRQSAELLAKALERRRWYDFAGAKVFLDAIVKRQPDYAEGWNQRAFILFLQEKYDESLSDLERALRLEPRHFGALAGQARILMRQGRFATGQKILKQAVKLHPFLRERSLLVQTEEREL